MWNIEQSESGWRVDINKLEQLVQPNTKLIVLNSPNNPTGHTLKKEEIEAITEIARRHDIYVFCDASTRA